MKIKTMFHLSTYQKFKRDTAGKLILLNIVHKICSIGKNIEWYLSQGQSDMYKIFKCVIFLCYNSIPNDLSLKKQNRTLYLQLWKKSNIHQKRTSK